MWQFVTSGVVYVLIFLFLSQVQESLLQSYKTLTDKNIMGARFKVTEADVVK